MVHNTRNAARKNALVRFLTPAQHVMSDTEKEALLRAPKAPHRRRVNSVSPAKPPIKLHPQRQILRRSERQKQKSKKLGGIDEDVENNEDSRLKSQSPQAGASRRSQPVTPPSSQHRVVDSHGNTVLESPWGSPDLLSLPRQLSFGGALDTSRSTNDPFVGGLRRISGEHKLDGLTESSKQGSPASSHDSSIPCLDSPSKRAPLRRSDDWVTESGRIAKASGSPVAIVYPEHSPPYAWALGPNLTLKLRDDGTPMLV